MFMEKYKPWKYYKDIFDINYDYLINNSYNTLVFDIDNTIINNRTKNVSYKEIDLFKKLKDMGFKIIIVSNSWPWRVRRISKSLGVKGLGLSFKPLIFNILKAKRYLKTSYENMVLIGDQLFTDVYAAYKTGIKSILVDPVDVYESFITIFNRGRENDIINRGDYYE